MSHVAATLLTKTLLVKKKRGGWHISSASVPSVWMGTTQTVSCWRLHGPEADPHQAQRRDHIHHHRPEAHTAIRYSSQNYSQMRAREAIMVLFIFTPSLHISFWMFHHFCTHNEHSHMWTLLKMDPPTLQPAIRSQPPLSDSCWIRWYRRGRWRWRRRAVPGGWSHYEALTCGLYFIPWWACERCRCPLDGTDERNIMLFCISLPQNQQHTSFQTSSFWPFYFHQFHFFKIQYQCQCWKMCQILFQYAEN